MLKKLLLVAALFVGTLGTSAWAADFNIIPAPQSLVEGQGHYVLSASTSVTYVGQEGSEVAKFFVDKVNAATRFGLTAKAGTSDTGIRFVLDAKVEGAEAYVLKVTGQGAEIKASTTDGLFYGMQTLLQLLPPEVEQVGSACRITGWEIPAVEIEDAPRFAYRGVMLDPCRHWLPADAVKRQIDALAMYKINRIHWHLTDDQGWRIEIKKYPELTQKGAFRTEGDGTVHGGYYTQDEVRDIVEYARQRHITIVPELELPGHELAAISAFPNLSCRGEAITPRIIWGVEDIVMCPGKEDMFRFLQDVIDEMVPLFPSKLFHIGGDESPRGEWEKCPNCQKRMKKLHLKKEAQLQTYIVGRIEKYLRAKGKTIIGWDEILEGGNLDNTSVVMSWRGEKGGIEAANAGHHVLMTPSDLGLYFDFTQGDPLTEPIAFGPKSYLEDVYAYDPMPKALRGTDKEKYVLGVQANCWSEYMPTYETLEYRLWPRALALAETGWSQLNRKNYSDFLRRLDGESYLRLQAHGLRMHIPTPETPGGSINKIAFTDTYDLTLTTTRPLDIVYTVDGQEPIASDTRYTGPLHFDRDAVVRTACVLPCGLMGPVRTISLHKEPLAPAVKQQSVEPGLRMSIAWGKFTGTGIPAEAFKQDSIIHRLRMLRQLTPVAGSVRDVKDYAAIAEGYVMIPADGVYDFQTNNHELWIDDRLVVDNSQLRCLRYCLNPASVALKSGLHKIKVLFVGGIFRGWPSYWDDASVKFRKQGAKDWEMIEGDKLFH